MSDKHAAARKRPEQIAGTLTRAIQEILARGLADPRYQGLVTITSVDCSPDLKQATVWVSVLPEAKQALTLHALTHATSYIRREAGLLMALRELPRLTFRTDTKSKKDTEIVAALSKVAQEREARQAVGDQAPRNQTDASGGQAQGEVEA
jgi:ribosome-binding factor A